MRPAPVQAIHDPACGTGGFLLIAHDYVSQHYELDRDQKKRLNFKALFGNELVDSVARLCMMDLYLHGIEGDGCPIHGGVNSLAQMPIAGDLKPVNWKGKPIPRYISWPVIFRTLFGDRLNAARVARVPVSSHSQTRTK